MRGLIALAAVCACVICAGCSWVKEMENPNLFQGDIVLDPGERPNVNSSVMFSSMRHGRWPGGRIPYVITGSIGAKGKKAIKNAIARYHKYTCIRFRKKRKSDKTYIRFYRGNGCSSPIGYRRGRVNSISLATGCWITGIVMHEIAHTLGILHEQSRPDRDKYIKIIWKNIPRSMRANFEKKSTSVVTSYGTPYDYSSMMHYGPKAFGNGKITIQTKIKSKQKLIGQRKGFSKIDKIQIRKMYRKTCSRRRSKSSTGSRRRVSRRRVSRRRVSGKKSKRRKSGSRRRVSRRRVSRRRVSRRRVSRKRVSRKQSKRRSNRRNPAPTCINKNSYCNDWARLGHCNNVKWRAYMHKDCCKACRGGKIAVVADI